MAKTTTTVRIDAETYEKLKELSKELKQPMLKVIQEALNEYKRKVILSATAKAFEELKKSPQKWEEELKERQLWENTLQDGVDDE